MEIILNFKRPDCKKISNVMYKRSSLLGLFLCFLDFSLLSRVFQCYLWQSDKLC